MKTPNQLMQTMGNATAVETAPLKIDTGTADVVNSLFKELKAIFPAWKQAWPLDDDLKTAKRSWIKAFVAQGITRIEQIRYGIENCRKLGTDFIPSVGKFVAMCQPSPEDLGILPHEAAYAEAIANAHPSMAGSREWSHQAVYHAASQCGFNALSTMKADISRKLFDRNYDITIQMMLAGERLRNIPLALPDRVDGRVTPEIGNQALANLRKSRGGHAHG
ncbi:Replication protein P [Pseudomonas sp. IT-P253]|uniref:replication protein P n=1 Tax=Pseudomonas sp. IT-P253 TaxID=3026455 RepID=UPI0039DFDEF4